MPKGKTGVLTPPRHPRHPELIMHYDLLEVPMLRRIAKGMCNIIDIIHVYYIYGNIMY